MRKRSILGILGLAASLLSGHDLMAAVTYEAHPGLFTSYEYTDNYHGDIHGGKSDSIYYVGPSLELSCKAPSADIDFTGSYAKSFHQRFSEDDSPEIHLTSHASYTTTLQATRLAYDFVRTLTRENLGEPFGEVKRNTGSILYSLSLTQRTSMTAGYDISTETWDVPSIEVAPLNHEDVIFMGGNLGITHQLNPLDTIMLTARQDYYDYKIIQNVVETNGGLRFTHAFSPSFNLGIDTHYTHDDRGRDPNEDRYDASLIGQYIFNQTTNMSVGGGYTWLITEHLDRQSVYLANATIEKNLKDDRFHLSVAKEFSAEFTTNRYGTYDTKSASLIWDRQWLQTWSTSTRASISDRKPTAGTPGLDETDTVLGFRVTWKPIEYFTSNIMYDHLQSKYETSGTARENRYMMMIEVRY